MRSLARKYNIAVSSISKKADKEGWDIQKQDITRKAGESIEQRAIECRASNQDKANDIVNSLMDKLKEAVRVVDKKDVRKMRDLVSSMKDLKELGVFDTGKADKEVVIRIEGGEDYGN